MNNDELSQRIAGLEAWVIEFRRTQPDSTYGEFWAAYKAHDPELLQVINGPEAASLPATIQSQLDALFDGMEILMDGQRHPDRRINDLSPIAE